jgi:hypothetical protein
MTERRSCPIKQLGGGGEKRKPGRPAKYTPEERLEARREANRRYRAKKKLQIAAALKEVDELQAELELLKLFKENDSDRTESAPTPSNSPLVSDSPPSSPVTTDRGGLVCNTEAEKGFFKCHLC